MKGQHRHAVAHFVHTYAGNGAQIQTCRCGAWRETTVIVRDGPSGPRRYHGGCWQPPKPTGP